MNARMRRITSDYEQIKKNFANHKNIVVEPIGEEPAEKYRVTYYVNGIYMMDDGRIETLGKHVVVITLHAEYPRYKPICTIATPIWHPNFRDGQICIGDIWGAGESLSDIIVNIGDMIQYKSWNSFSPLSADAAEWAINNKHLFPVGNINLWTGEEEDGNIKKEFEIDIFGDESNALEEPLTESRTEVQNSLAEEAPKKQSSLNPDAMENDFEITAEELQGIEFVPTADRMHGAQYGSTAKGKGLNFKTVLIKGLLWALIGAFIGFGISELAKDLTSNATVARLFGYTELGDFYEYTEKANNEMKPVYDDYEKYCKKNGLNPEDDSNLDAWFAENSSKYEGNFSRYSEYYDNATNAFVNTYTDDFDGDEEKLDAVTGNISRCSTALWSALIALFIGLFLGIGEGVYYGSSEKAVKYALIGAGISLGIGLFSGYIAQWMYATLLKEDSPMLIKSIIRGMGWAIMGVGVGLSVGLIKPQFKRLLFCSLGGLAGAFTGGFLFNYITEKVPYDILARGVALIIMGLLIGLGVGLLEQVAKSAWLKVIRGEFEGKEYLVFAGTTSIGNSGKNTIVLFKDKLVAPMHCDIVLEGNKYVIVDKGSPMGTIVNGMRVSRHVLKQGDAIALGNSVLIFNTK